MKRIFLVLIMLSSPVFAQQQQTPPEVALQINGVIGQWAQTIVQQQRTIMEQQAQISAKDAKIKELEEKNK
jgi:hypothetical protein